MQAIEYRGIIDKSTWGDGPWQREPDKAQWQDEVTGLPCLAVRGPFGSWCGYVGVVPTHPAHGLDYHGEPHDIAETRREITRKAIRANIGKPLEDWSRVPEGALREKLSAIGEKVCALEVHGGLTFAGECADQRREAWEVFRLKRATAIATARIFPKGDSAEWLKKWDGCFDDYERWRERTQATAICHLPGPGEPDDVWWFGFDCGHAWDFQPGMIAHLLDLGPRYLRDYRDEIYRDLDYIRGECARLAQQLAVIT